MSGLFIGFSRPYGCEDVLRELSFAKTTVHSTCSCDGIDIGVTRVDDLGLWAPASDPLSGTYVALGGRLAFEEAEWNKSRQLPFEGGRACKLVMDKWLESPESLSDELNGTYCVVIYDSHKRRLHLWTDRLGVFPMYYCPKGPFVLCSHPDVLADELKRYGYSLEWDFVTFAESISTGSGVHPFTFYKGMEQLDAASHYIWRIQDGRAVHEEHSSYWKPKYLERVPNESEEVLIHELAEAFRSAMRRRTAPTLGKTGVFLSAGADSRGILFGAPRPSEMECMTFYDQYNIEVKTAQRLTAVAQAEHHTWQRDPEYYPRTAAETMRIAGGMWISIDSHYLGFQNKLEALNFGGVYTGCYVDCLFKGLAFNRRHRLFMGKPLPLYDFADFNFSFYHAHTNLRYKWQELVNHRLETRFPPNLRSNSNSNRLAIEDLRMRPMSRGAGFSGRAVLLRTLPWDHVISDKDVLDVYGRIPAKHKLNGVLFGKAIAVITGERASKIKNNNYCARVDASEAKRARQFMLGVIKRKISKVVFPRKQLTGIATVGSWPDWHYVVSNSRIIDEIWSMPSASEKEFFVDLIGYDPWSKSLAEWGAGDHIFFMRLFSRLLWMRQRRVL